MTFLNRAPSPMTPVVWPTDRPSVRSAGIFNDDDANACVFASCNEVLISPRSHSTRTYRPSPPLPLLLHGASVWTLFSNWRALQCIIASAAAAEPTTLSRTPSDKSWLRERIATVGLYRPIGLLGDRPAVHAAYTVGYIPEPKIIENFYCTLPFLTCLPFPLSSPLYSFPFPPSPSPPSLSLSPPLFL